MLGLLRTQCVRIYLIIICDSRHIFFYFKLYNISMKQSSNFQLFPYLFYVCLLSWPFQIAYGFLGDSFRPLLLISMIMTMVATWSYKRRMEDSPTLLTRRPSLIAILFALGLALWLWLMPIFIESLLGLHTIDTPKLTTLAWFFLTSVFLTLIPAFSEEYSWRGYLLPQLMTSMTARKALLLHGVVTWVWHLPVLVVMGLGMGGNWLVAIPVLLLVSVVPSVMHAVVFARFYIGFQSIFVATLYHVGFDEVRDTLSAQFGFGPVVEIWQMAWLTVIGIVMVIRISWLSRKSKA